MDRQGGRNGESGGVIARAVEVGGWWKGVSGVSRLQWGVW